MPSVIQDWACAIPFMQQAVLITSVRGPDGLHKNHISKFILFWLRRCFLISAFERRAVWDPVNGKDQTFTGAVRHPNAYQDELFRRAYCQLDFPHNPPCESSRPDVPTRHMRPEDDQRYWVFLLDACAAEYLRSVDEVPHHFHLHLMHAAEILGYQHPESWIREWWYTFYRQLVADAHLHPESRDEMCRRLGDNQEHWQEREVVAAGDVPKVGP